MSDLEKCKKYLRSILLASKGGILASRVFDSYKDMVGEKIPYQKFNFSSLETFLQSIPDVCRITFKGRDIFVVGVASAETQHIEKLVQKQGGKSGGGGNARRGTNAKANDWRQFYPGASAQNNSMKKSGTSEKSSSKSTKISSTNGGLKIETKRAPAPVRIAPKRVTGPTPVNVNGTAKSPSAKTVPVTKQSIKTWTARVRKLLEGRTHGLMKSQVEKFYEKQWDEKLPYHWTDVMLEDEIIDMKRESNQSNYIVILRQMSSQSTVTADTSISIPGGCYPTSSNWTVTITNVVSTSHLWVMFGEAPLKLEALQRVMEMRHKAGQPFSGSQMPPGNYFSAKLDSGEYVRVKVSKVDRMKHTCHCFIVDYGKEIQIDWSKLTNLHKDFLTLPTMAMKVILSGVENSKEPELVEYVRNKLIGNKMRAIEVANGVNNIPMIHLLDGDNVVSEEITRHIHKLAAHVLDQNKTFNNNLYNVPNRNLHGYDKVSCLSPAYLPGVGEFYDLKISHIVTMGEIYAQSYTSLAKYAIMTQNMNRYYEGDGVRDRVDKPEPGQLVAVRRHGDWRRVQVMVEIDCQELIVKLVDSGETVTVNINEIKLLHERFTELPIQAVKIKLSAIDNSEEAASVWLRHFCEGKGLVGMIDAKVGSLLSVTLYDTNNINQDININKELQKLGLAK